MQTQSFPTQHPLPPLLSKARILCTDGSPGKLVPAPRPGNTWRVCDNTFPLPAMGLGADSPPSSVQFCGDARQELPGKGCTIPEKELRDTQSLSSSGHCCMWMLGMGTPWSSSCWSADEADAKIEMAGPTFSTASLKSQPSPPKPFPRLEDPLCETSN